MTLRSMLSITPCVVERRRVREVAVTKDTSAAQWFTLRMDHESPYCRQACTP